MALRNENLSPRTRKTLSMSLRLMRGIIDKPHLDEAQQFPTNFNPWSRDLDRYLVQLNGLEGFFSYLATLPTRKVLDVGAGTT